MRGERRPGQTRGRASNRVPGPTFDMKRAVEAWPTVLGQTASNHGRKLIRPAQRHGRNDGFREGFRMPARRDLSTGRGAGVRKPPRKEPAGTCWAVCVYGDLTGRRLQRGLGSASSLGVDCRPSLRIGCCRRTGRCDSATVGGLAWGFAGTGAAVVRRRERHVPAGGWCNEAVRVVMALRS